MAFKEYKEYYHTHKRFPNGAYVNPDKTLNELQLKSKYEKYLKSLEKAEDRKSRYVEKSKEPKEQTTRSKRIEEAMKSVKEKDPEGKLFWSRLTEEEAVFIKKNMWGFMAIYDVAHVIGRGRNPTLAEDENNMIVVPRAFHTFIDNRLNPFSDKHEHITEEQASDIWKRLIGEERFEGLIKK